MRAWWYWLVIGALVTWRVTHLMHVEDGPWQVFARLRRGVAKEGLFGQLLACFYCLSIWVAVPVAYLIGESWTERLLLVPALSAAAILIERRDGAMPDYAEDVPEPPA